MFWAQDSNLRGISPAAYKTAAVNRLANPEHNRLKIKTRFCLVADDIGLEPMRRFPNDSLANCSLNHSGNHPYFCGDCEIRTHGPVSNGGRWES